MAGAGPSGISWGNPPPRSQKIQMTNAIISRMPTTVQSRFPICVSPIRYAVVMLSRLRLWWGWRAMLRRRKKNLAKLPPPDLSYLFGEAEPVRMYGVVIKED